MKRLLELPEIFLSAFDELCQIKTECADAIQSAKVVEGRARELANTEATRRAHSLFLALDILYVQLEAAWKVANDSLVENLTSADDVEVTLRQFFCLVTSTNEGSPSELIKHDLRSISDKLKEIDNELQ